MAAVATVQREGRAAIVRLHGDLVVPTSEQLYGQLRSVSRRRDVKKVVLDFRDAGRVDSAGVAVISLVGRQLRKAGKALEFDQLADRHRAALELVPAGETRHRPDLEVPPYLERLGDRVIGLARSARALFALVGETVHQSAAVALGKRRLPANALANQIAIMGVEGVFIVGLLSFLLGMTMAFQGAVQLQRFGAGVFVADMVGMTMVRELAPMMTAVILTGRTGAAIAAELGTMRVRSEIDALSTMGINPVRFLIVPRTVALTLVLPALALMAMFIGMLGGMVVTMFAIELPPIAYWQRIAERVELGDYLHGIGKSFVFAWIIGFAASHLGMRAGGDASSVGNATTKTVVTSILFIIVVDAIFATIATILRYG